MSRGVSSWLTSNKSKRFTNANRVAMRRCLEANVRRLVDGIDNECSSDTRSGDPVDDVFDGYLLSCVN